MPSFLDSRDRGINFLFPDSTVQLRTVTPTELTTQAEASILAARDSVGAVYPGGGSFFAPFFSSTAVREVRIASIEALVPGHPTVTIGPGGIAFTAPEVDADRVDSIYFVAYYALIGNAEDASVIEEFRFRDSNNQLDTQTAENTRRIRSVWGLIYSQDRNLTPENLLALVGNTSRLRQRTLSLVNGEAQLNSAPNPETRLYGLGFPVPSTTYTVLETAIGIFKLCDITRTVGDGSPAFAFQAFDTSVAARIERPGSLDTQVNQNQVNIADLQPRVTQNEADIAALQSSGVDAGLGDRVTANETAISVVDARLETVEVEVSGIRISHFFSDNTITAASFASPQIVPGLALRFGGSFADSINSGEVIRIVEQGTYLVEYSISLVLQQAIAAAVLVNTSDGSIVSDILGSDCISPFADRTQAASPESAVVRGQNVVFVGTSNLEFNLDVLGSFTNGGSIRVGAERSIDFFGDNPSNFESLRPGAASPQAPNSPSAYVTITRMATN